GMGGRTDGLGAGVLAAYPRRLSSGRTNPYVAPQGYLNLPKSGLQSFETSQCSSGINATLNPNTPNDPTFQARADGTLAGAQDLFARIQQFMFDKKPDAASIPQTGCKKQAKFHSIGVSPEFTRYLHVRKEK